MECLFKANITSTSSRGVPVALVLTDSLGGCEVLKASNPKRSENAFSMYVSLPPVITLGLSAFGKDTAKIKIIIQYSKFLRKKFQK